MFTITGPTDNINKTDTYHLAKLNPELRVIKKHSLKIRQDNLISTLRIGNL